MIFDKHEKVISICNVLHCDSGSRCDLIISSSVYSLMWWLGAMKSNEIWWIKTSEQSDGIIFTEMAHFPNDPHPLPLRYVSCMNYMAISWLFFFVIVGSLSVFKNSALFISNSLLFPSYISYQMYYVFHHPCLDSVNWPLYVPWLLWAGIIIINKRQFFSWSNRNRGWIPK